jgi:hypothetical protein
MKRSRCHRKTPGAELKRKWNACRKCPHSKSHTINKAQVMAYRTIGIALGTGVHEKHSRTRDKKTAETR